MTSGVSILSVTESRALRAETVEKAKADCDRLKYPDLRQDCLNDLNK